MKRGWIGGFVLLSAIWGSSFALIKVAVDAGVAPIWVALWRCFFGALTLWVICLANRASIPRNRHTWGHAAIVALLLNAVPFVLLAYGETRVSSVLAGVWDATTPLTTLFFVLALIRAERPMARLLLGLLVGFAGVLVVLGVWHGIDTGTLIGTLACMSATTCSSAGFVYIRRFLSNCRESATALSAAQITLATVELVLIIPLTNGLPIWPGAAAAASLLALGALGTGVAYILNFRLIRTVGPTVTSMVTYVIPLWSTLLGWALLGESLSWNVVVGGVLVISGVVLTQY
ncbi:MAG: DMT family transporter [Candidatus Dormibacteraceae bacterium]